MRASAIDYWQRAKKSLIVAQKILALDPDSAASRAYYAAFYAVSALFILEDKAFRRHSAIEAAVHRDLVKTGAWTRELGEGYSTLVRLRNTGDYGGAQHVPPAKAQAALQTAADILQAVAKSDPELFGGLDEC